MFSKILIFCLLITSCFSSPLPRHIRFFGNILGEVAWKYRYIGTERPLRLANWEKENKITFTFPQVFYYRENSLQITFSKRLFFQLQPGYHYPSKSIIINAIQQIDFTQDQAKVNFLDGGLGSNEVTIEITVPQGKPMGTEFHFYGETVSRIFF